MDKLYNYFIKDFNENATKTLFGRQLRQVFPNVQNINPGTGPNATYYKGITYHHPTQATVTRQEEAPPPATSTQAAQTSPPARVVDTGAQTTLPASTNDAGAQTMDDMELASARRRIQELRDTLHKRRVMSTSKLPAFMHLDKTMIVEKRVIGSGSFGRCLYGQYRGIQVVIKQLTNMKHGTVLLEKEALTMINLPSHPNLPTLLGVHRGSLSLVVQFYACGNAVVTVTKAAQKLLDVSWRTILVGIARGLQAMHDHSIVHNDLHGEL